jgi:hypothetical protein
MQQSVAKPGNSICIGNSLDTATTMNSILLFLAYSPKMKVTLSNHQSVCLSVYITYNL